MIDLEEQTNPVQAPAGIFTCDQHKRVLLFAATLLTSATLFTKWFVRSGLSWTTPCCPLSLDFLRRERVVRWQDGRKKFGERAGVRGSFYTASTRESPLLRPNGQLLPRGGEGPLFHSANSGQETPSVNRSRQTWRCSLQNAGSLVAEFQVCDRSHASSSMMSGKSLGRPAACLFFNNVRGEITGIVSPSSSILRLVS